MRPVLIRQLWSLVTAGRNRSLAELDDANLVDSLVQQLLRQQSVDSEELQKVDRYVRSRMPLIRELVENPPAASS